MILSAKIQVIAQPFLVGAVSVVRNRPLPQNDLELCQQGKRDVTHRVLSNFEDILLVRMISYGRQSHSEKTLVRNMSLIYWNIKAMWEVRT
jgi:hypothetical protein